MANEEPGIGGSLEWVLHVHWHYDFQFISYRFGRHPGVAVIKLQIIEPWLDCFDRSFEILFSLQPLLFENQLSELSGFIKCPGKEEAHIYIRSLATDVKVYQGIRSKDFDQLDCFLRGRNCEGFLLTEKDIYRITRIGGGAVDLLLGFEDPGEFLVELLDKRGVLKLLKDG